MTKSLRYLASGLMLMIFALSAQAALPESVSKALKAAGIPESNVAIYVQPVAAPAPTLQLNATKSMNPASVMKLVTTYVGLELLKPNFRWKTEVYTDGSVNNGVLSGNLIFKGYGDPSFDEAQFRRLLVSLQQAGIHTINGNIIIDKSYFSPEVGRQLVIDEESWRAYNAQPSAFLVDGRKTSFKFMVKNDAVQIQQEAPLPELKIINKMQLSQNDCGSWRNDLAYDVNASATQATVTFRGHFPATCDDKYLELSVFDDTQYAFFMVKKLWHQLDGVFNGQLSQQTEINSSQLLITQYSEPLSSVIRDINKWSNNLMARQLLLTIAAERNAPPANEIKGMLSIKDWLNLTAENTDALVIENGSGLSRVERVSAQLLGHMLVSAYHSPVMSELMSSLPILSLDGTAQRRLIGTAVSARAHLKTGSINGVSAIAGYVLTEHNARYVLVMLVNDANAFASKSAQDALITWVYQQP